MPIADYPHAEPRTARHFLVSHIQQWRQHGSGFAEGMANLHLIDFPPRQTGEAIRGVAPLEFSGTVGEHAQQQIPPIAVFGAGQGSRHLLDE